MVARGTRRSGTRNRTEKKSPFMGKRNVSRTDPIAVFDPSESVNRQYEGNKRHPASNNTSKKVHGATKGHPAITQQKASAAVKAAKPATDKANVPGPSSVPPDEPPEGSVGGGKHPTTAVPAVEERSEDINESAAEVKDERCDDEQNGSRTQQPAASEIIDENDDDRDPPAERSEAPNSTGWEENAEGEDEASTPLPAKSSRTIGPPVVKHSVRFMDQPTIARSSKGSTGGRQRRSAAKHQTEERPWWEIAACTSIGCNSVPEFLTELDQFPLTRSLPSSVSSVSDSSKSSKSSKRSQGTGSSVMETLFGETGLVGLRKRVSSNDFEDSVVPRELLPWSVIPTLDDKWVVTMQTNQAALDAGKAAEASRSLRAVTLPTEKQAICVAKAWTPPRMLPLEDNTSCNICSSKFAVFRRPNHCRNCGVCICKDCAVQWSAKMIPETYKMRREFSVNVCKSCDKLCSSFRLALLEGDMDKAVIIHATGNVNLSCPFANVKGDEILFPVHCAVLGGNLDLVRWLIDEHYCPIKFSRAPNQDKRDDSRPKHTPIVTSKGRSLLGIALEKEIVDIVRYLVAEKGMRISQEKDVSKSMIAKNLENVLRLMQDKGDTTDDGRSDDSLADSPFSISEEAEPSETLPVPVPAPVPEGSSPTDESSTPPSTGHTDSSSLPPAAPSAPTSESADSKPLPPKAPNAPPAPTSFSQTKLENSILDESQEFGDIHLETFSWEDQGQ